MDGWRDRRSLSVLVLGLIFLVLATRPIPKLESGIQSLSSFFLPLIKGLTPFRPIAGARPVEAPPLPEGTPDAVFLTRREAESWKPRDERLLARAFAFASRRSDSSEPETIWLAAGSKHGVIEGMLGVAGDALLGEIVEVEVQRSLLRFSTHPDSQLGARAGETRLIAAGGRHGLLRVELPSGRGLEPGEEVRGDPVPALLGRLEPSTSGRRGALAIRPAVQTAALAGVWLLRSSEGGQAAPIVLDAPAQEWVQASALWPEISPQARGGVFHSAQASEILSGAACVAGGWFWGVVQCKNEETIWIRSIDDPSLRWDALLARDDGAVLALKGFSLGSGSRSTANLSIAQRPGLGEGWLFTAGGTSGISKGLLVGRVRRAESGFFLDRDFSRLPATLRVEASRSVP